MQTCIMAQLMPLPITVYRFSKIQIGFTFLVPAHPGSPGKRAVKRVCVCVCVCVCLVLSIIGIAIVLGLEHAIGAAHVLIQPCCGLRQRLVATWAEFQHSVVCYATDQCQKRLEVCINAEGVTLNTLLA